MCAAIGALYRHWRHVLWTVPALALALAPAPLAAASARPAPSSLFWPFTVLAVALAAIGIVCFVVLRWREAEAREAMSRAALDAVTEPVLMTDSGGHALIANTAWRSRFGDGEAAPLEALGRWLEDRSVLARLRVAAAAYESAREDCALLDENGRRRWTALSVAPAIGQPGAVLWTAADADMRNALDAAIAAERARIAEFIDDFPLGCFAVGADGRFLEANRAFAGWLGTTRDELVGNGIRLADIVADDRSDDVPPWRAVPVTGGDGSTAIGEVLMKDLHGRRFMARLSQTLIREGASVAALSLARDMSGERDLSVALRHAEERFHRFFDEAPVGIALADPDGTITESSKAFDRMALAGHGSATGAALWTLVPEVDREQLRQWFAGAADDSPPLRVTFPGMADNGSEAHPVFASLFARRYEADDGGPGGIVVHALDQTEQQNIETQFFQSQKMELVGQLAGGIAHDFNNLLTAMIGFCDLLLQRHSPKDQSFADIMQIKQNANRAANLVRQLLAFSRQQTLQPRVLDITDVLTELSHLLRRLIGASIELEMVHGRDIGLVKVDQSQLEQVIINLVVNARDAIGDGGKLVIRTRAVSAAEPARAGHQRLPAGDYVALEVEDNGCGIAREHLDKIFEPFFTTKEVGSGTGLGLSTVYGIIKQTGGHIFVDSAPGRGTRFAIYLPRFEAAAEEARAAVTSLSRPPPPARDLTGAGTVLLVEDEDAVRMFGARALRNKGYNVREASSGEEALTLLGDGAADEIDVLITDVVMPGLDGPAMIRKVRETHPDMKVIFISGYTEDSFRQRLDSEEAVHFLPKPFTLEQLAGKVKEIMAEGAG